MAPTTTRRLRTNDEPTNSAYDSRTTSPRDIARDDIARRAYELFERRGGEDGHDVDDWLEAERNLMQRSSE